jgi:hypothetical protein
METREMLRDAFDRVVEDVEGAVAGLTAEQLAWRPDPEANSIAWLVWHLTRVHDDHVAELAQREQAYTELGFADRFALDLEPAEIGYGHTSEQVAKVRVDGSAILVEYVRAVTARTHEYLATVDAAELDRIVDRRWDPPVTAGVRLVSVINDATQHAGQAAYVRGLLERSEAR